MAVKNLIWRITGVDKFSPTLKKISEKAQKVQKKIGGRGGALAGGAAKGAKRGILGSLAGGLSAVPIAGAFAAVGTGVGFAINQFKKYEQGIINVQKTTGLSFKSIDKTISSLSTKLPVSTDALLEIAGAAGQLGVKGEKNIAKFTETFAKLEVASDVSGEQGAKAIARILTVTKEGVGTIDRFSSALVDLGNNSAASESEIVHMATKIAGATARFDVNSANVLGISTALKSLGRNAEESGGVVGRSFNAISQALQQGGFALTQLETITGKSGEELKKQFSKDSVSVFKDLIDGLSQYGKENKNVSLALRNMGLSGIRVDSILGTLIKNNDVLTTSLDRSGRAYSKNTALGIEFAQQSKTMNSAFTRLGNSISLISREFVQWSGIDKGVKAHLDVLSDLLNIAGKEETWGSFFTKLSKRMQMGPEGGAVLSGFQRKDGTIDDTAAKEYHRKEKRKELQKLQTSSPHGFGATLKDIEKPYEKKQLVVSFQGEEMKKFFKIHEEVTPFGALTEESAFVGTF